MLKTFIPKVIRYLYASSLLLFVHRHLHDIAFTSVHSVTLCAILYERRILSVHITERANTDVYKIVYKKGYYTETYNVFRYESINVTYSP